MTVDPLRVVYIELDPATDFNSSIFRLHLPARALTATGVYKATVVREKEWMAEQLAASVVCADAHLIVMQRPWKMDHVLMMKKWLARKKPVFIDFDDAYDRLDPDNLAYPFWNLVEIHDGRSVRKIDMFREALNLATGVTVASRKLEEDWRPQLRHGNIGTFPNYLDTALYRDIPQRPAPRPGEMATLGFGGSTSHYKGFKDSGLMAAIKRLARVRKDFRVAIHTPDQRLALGVAADIGLRASWYRWMSYAQWPKAMAEFDIALAPLSGIVDQRRSFLRVAEAMSLGVPWIGNRGGSYDAYDRDGNLIDQGARKWEEAITHFLETLEERKAAAAQMRAEAYDHFDINSKVEGIVEGYQEMMG